MCETGHGPLSGTEPVLALFPFRYSAIPVPRQHGELILSAVFLRMKKNKNGNVCVIVYGKSVWCENG